MQELSLARKEGGGDREGKNVNRRSAKKYVRSKLFFRAEGSAPIPHDPYIISRFYATHFIRSTEVGRGSPVAFSLQGHHWVSWRGPRTLFLLDQNAAKIVFRIISPDVPSEGRQLRRWRCDWGGWVWEGSIDVTIRAAPALLREAWRPLEIAHDGRAYHRERARHLTVAPRAREGRRR